jgi:hypothetical protein
VEEAGHGVGRRGYFALPRLGSDQACNGPTFFSFFFFGLTSNLCKIYLTDEYLEIFHTLTSVARSSIFRDFWRFFYFFEFKFKILNWGGIEPAGTGTGPVRFHRFPRYPDRFRPVPLTLATTERGGSNALLCLVS